MGNSIKKILMMILGPRFGASLISQIQMLKFSKGELSFSQEGEDRLLANLFRHKNQGLYIDVGAHHPYCLSNTNLFYERGWSGINIDANPDCMKLFAKHRPRDINIVCGVGQKSDEMTFYIFDEPALSSFDPNLSAEREKQGRKIKSTAKIRIKPLKDILTEKLSPGTVIDFMSVDVEGLDLDVLKSNDWEIYRPQYVLVECYDLDIEKIQDNETYRFLKNNGYDFMSKLVNTCLFVDHRKR